MQWIPSKQKKFLNIYPSLHFSQLIPFKLIFLYLYKNFFSSEIILLFIPYFQLLTFKQFHSSQTFQNKLYLYIFYLYFLYGIYLQIYYTNFQSYLKLNIYINHFSHYYHNINDLLG
jgi:hypothetical protein